jgi:hypothetical protein
VRLELVVDTSTMRVFVSRCGSTRVRRPRIEGTAAPSRSIVDRRAAGG